MCVVCDVAYGATSGVLALSSSGAVPVAELASIDRDQNTSLSRLLDMQPAPEALEKVTIPKIGQPKWYQEQVAEEEAAAARAAAERQATAPPGQTRTVTYSVKTQGATRSNLAEFSAQANQTLNDTRGWSQLGFTFKEVQGGGDFNLVLADAATVGSYAGCSAQWSCRVGAAVLINDDRWQYATDAWNNAGGGLRDYRHMVVNHEVGHWLGHGHRGCESPGSYAPLMQQQSIDLQGCKFNPWPLASELWSSR